MKSNKFWVTIVLVLLVICGIASVMVYRYVGSGSIVSVYQDGVLLKQIHLDTVTTPYTFTVEAPNGGYNTISVEQGRICITEASCPDHVCINTGWISDGAIPIVCLPNKLVIQPQKASDDIVDSAVQ